jgi:hypothetical protein
MKAGSMSPSAIRSELESDSAVYLGAYSEVFLGVP